MVSTLQKSAIYVEGELLRAAPGERVAFTPGEYNVRFVAEDGRSVSRRVVISGGEVTKHIYDFDKVSWR